MGLLRKKKPIKGLDKIGKGKFFVVEEGEHAEPVLVGQFTSKPVKRPTEEPLVWAKVANKPGSKVEERALGTSTDLGLAEDSTRTSYFISYDPLHPN